MTKAKQYIITFLCIITLNFFIPRLMPGDPFTFLSAEEGQVHTAFSHEDIEKYKAYYGLDKPLGHQYINYVKNIFKGDLGYSIFYKEKVLTIVIGRIPWTLFLVILAIISSSIIGVFLGSLSAYWRDSPIDKFLYFFFITLSEIPSFLVAFVLLFFLSAQLKLFPLSGGMSHFVEFSSMGDKIWDMIYHAILPLIALTVTRIGEFYLLTRNSMIHVLQKDYIRTAKGKGLKKARILFLHGFRNAIPPVITRIFLSLGGILGGAVLVENVFRYPGIGGLIRQAVFFRDYPLIQGIFLVMTLLVLTMNYVAEIVYKKLDPRVN
ncbi:ABC transporter permease [Natronincola ferrireducens]|uniref:Peptide/nickel transport system permease protein n=1 Tax=Natronincola ferrireducens TaxID=393762 RepID=A0A1G8ZSZ2_9FIRM|nr:ABC transporter permease [Natronincola ferrireducens]SDK18242.1 peptide/nickel transport system permease protein [Natronincola ferrireducens]